MQWGSIGGDDVPRVAALLTAVEGHDRTGPRILHGWRHQLSPRSVESEFTLAARTSDGALAALGWISPRPYDNPPRRVLLAGSVHPDRRGRGLGRELLDWQLAAALDWQRTQGVEPIIIVASVPRAPDGHVPPAAIALLAHARLAPTRVFAELRLDLRDRHPKRPHPGIAIEPFSPERAEDVRIALNASFADHWGSRPVQPEPWRALIAEDAFRPEWSWVAVAGDDIVGLVLNSAEPDPVAGTVGWTDQLGVLPACRGRGLAAALMAATLDSFAGAEIATAGLGVDAENPFGARSLYARLGYHARFDVGLFTRIEPGVPPQRSR